MAGTVRALDAELKNGDFEGENRYYQGIIGGTYQINRVLSISLGGKYVYSVRKLAGDAEYSFYKGNPTGDSINGNELHIKSKREADGFGEVFGLNIRVNENLNIGMKYDTPVKLTFDTNAVEDKKIYIGALGKNLGISDFYPAYKDAYSGSRDLPGVLSLGISGKVNRFILMTDITVILTRFPILIIWIMITEMKSTLV
ncbi:MAG: hypothetical protein LBV03_04005 [Fusobacteriales bacterium]|nr:hypothetical protein [Fusobacteriales bacterium]